MSMPDAFEHVASSPDGQLPFRAKVRGLREGDITIAPEGSFTPSALAVDAFRRRPRGAVSFGVGVLAAAAALRWREAARNRDDGGSVDG